MIDIKRHPIYSDYGVTEDGTIYSFKRKRPRKISIVKSGKYFQVYIQDIKRPYGVHRFIYECFYGPVPAGLFVCHNNGDSIDNRVENLRVDTPKNNSRDALKHGTLAVGERQGLSKLTEEQVVDIRNQHAAGISFEELAAKFGMEKSSIVKIIKGEHWKYVGGPTSKRKPRRKLFDEDVRKIKKLVEIQNITNREIARRFGVSPATITDIVKGRSRSEVVV